jgi:hypothetical protein
MSKNKDFFKEVITILQFYRSLMKIYIWRASSPKCGSNIWQVEKNIVGHNTQIRSIRRGWIEQHSLFVNTIKRSCHLQKAEILE